MQKKGESYCHVVYPTLSFIVVSRTICRFLCGLHTKTLILKGELMKTKLFFLCIGTIFLLALNVQAAPIFFDNFEGDLSAWTGKNEGAFNGQIVVDPLDSSNHVLNFNALNSGGDIYTNGGSFSAGTYWLAFDYLGQGETNDSGGYFGVSEDFPGINKWFWATGTASGAEDVLIDDGTWHSYLFKLAYDHDFHLMLEEYKRSDSIIGNAYFDNIVLSAVPEPATMLLFGAGLLGLAGLGRKKISKKA
jgi:hypothetical protein